MGYACELPVEGSIHITEGGVQMADANKRSNLMKRIGIWFRWFFQIGFLLLCTALVMVQLWSVNRSLRSIGTSTEELASTTRVHYEPTTFVVNVTRTSDTYKPGKGIPACSEYVRQIVNGDSQSFDDLRADGYYVVSVTTHSQTGNQTNVTTGRRKPEKETGYEACNTTGLLYILRRDLGGRS
jgi:hypothetical protein